MTINAGISANIQEIVFHAGNVPDVLAATPYFSLCVVSSGGVRMCVGAGVVILDPGKKEHFFV